MYDERIEQLISAALADGVLTEKEKQVLFKRAQEQGIDLDEFEMVLDARLVELQKAEKEKGGKSAPKSTKFGDVRKCPVCGALVPALAVSCAECGYEFSGVNASSSAQKLAQQISEIRKQVKDEFLANEQIVSLIDTFPVPNTKNDLFDMIIFLKNHEYDDKYNECLEKARLLFPNDPMIKPLIAEAENKKKEEKADEASMVVGFVSVFVIIAIFCLVAYIKDYSFWGWVGMVFAGMAVGEIIGLAVVWPILKSILRKR